MAAGGGGGRERWGGGGRERTTPRTGEGVYANIPELLTVAYIQAHVPVLHAVLNGTDKRIVTFAVLGILGDVR